MYGLEADRSTSEVNNFGLWAMVGVGVLKRFIRTVLYWSIRTLLVARKQHI